MAIYRDNPYGAFNFQVTVDRFGDAAGFRAGFQEISGLGLEVTVAEYRNGNEKENAVRKLTGLTRVSDVTLKRGIIGSLVLYQWLDQVRTGDQGALRTVLVHLLSEDHTATVVTWKLHRARIVRHVSGPFNAKNSEVAIEELTLAYERLEME